MNAAAAEPPQSVPGAGHYATEGAWGYLNIQRSGARTEFKIDSVVGESVCAIEGEIQGSTGSGKLASGEVCKVNFKQQGAGIKVEVSTPEVCQHFCGQNSSFDAEYLRLKPACEIDAIESTRRSFQRHYDKKAFAAAQKTLAPVVSQCLSKDGFGKQGAVPFAEEGAIRNDYALVLHKLGQNVQCKTVLAPYAGDARQTDDELLNGNSWGPLFARTYLPIISAARTNLRLCGSR